jgi:hypothetical protein
VRTLLLAKNTLRNIARYHFIVASAAMLLTAETYILTHHTTNYILLLTIFVATLCAYTFADLELSITAKAKKTRISITGTKTSLNIAGTSVTTFLLLTPFQNLQIQTLLLLVTICSLLYINPVRIQSKPSARNAQFPLR